MSLVTGRSRGRKTAPAIPPGNSATVGIIASAILLVIAFNTVGIHIWSVITCLVLGIIIDALAGYKPERMISYKTTKKYTKE